MAIANCKRCGRMYNKVGRDVCTECIREEDELLKEIRLFLRQHPRANIYEVAENTRVEELVIIEFIRDGRLLLRDNPNMGYACERCGKQTMSGRFCSACTAELAQSLGHASEKLREKNRQEDRPTGGFFSR